MRVVIKTQTHMLLSNYLLWGIEVKTSGYLALMYIQKVNLSLYLITKYTWF